MPPRELTGKLLGGIVECVAMVLFLALSAGLTWILGIRWTWM